MTLDRLALMNTGDLSRIAATGTLPFPLTLKEFYLIFFFRRRRNKERERKRWPSLFRRRQYFYIYDRSSFLDYIWFTKKGGPSGYFNRDSNLGLSLSGRLFWTGFEALRFCIKRLIIHMRNIIITIFSCCTWCLFYDNKCCIRDNATLLSKIQYCLNIGNCLFLFM